MKHYRFIQCYFRRTRDIRHCDTIGFFPHAIPFPQVRLKDFLSQAASEIVSLLTQPSSTVAPSLQEGDPFRNTLLTLVHLLKLTNAIPNPSSSQSAVTDTLYRGNIPLPRVDHESLPGVMNSNGTTKPNLKNNQSTNSSLHIILNDDYNMHDIQDLKM